MRQSNGLREDNDRSELGEQIARHCHTGGSSDKMLFSRFRCRVSSDSGSDRGSPRSCRRLSTYTCTREHEKQREAHRGMEGPRRGWLSRALIANSV